MGWSRSGDRFQSGMWGCCLPGYCGISRWIVSDGSSPTESYYDEIQTRMTDNPVSSVCRASPFNLSSLKITPRDSPAASSCKQQQPAVDPFDTTKPHHLLQGFIADTWDRRSTCVHLDRKLDCWGGWAPSGGAPETFNDWWHQEQLILKAAVSWAAPWAPWRVTERRVIGCEHEAQYLFSAVNSCNIIIHYSFSLLDPHLCT